MHVHHVSLDTSQEASTIVPINATSGARAEPHPDRAEQWRQRHLQRAMCRYDLV